ncbi:hypothetical protein PUNSTDRAFT_77380 [Punctularia strigosozonata HHB-11173 SS5]|uniref:BTB domain-containing protein n=1 Tax=Punctularia strigosozonata (strain HHB-11173) TaxID=741275 RepID=R7S244_PUNST|nr:uncharacterized protein PUNSTDRAFT_77380 [Punctularia strigosozonata HHB-11173 SS5]EIN03852.1 hypothetical protein PUNSTDRAFT_77380 [Punctularia strigosozonata HHB-11173 SS5]
MSDVTDAGPPFNKATADLIIRSTDKRDDQSSTKKKELRDGLPIIPMSENAKTVELLLRLCYPHRTPAPDNLTEVMDVLSAAIKYEMDIVNGPLKDMLLENARRAPVRVYGFAVRHDLEAVARHSARASLRYPLLKVVTEDVPELCAIPSHHYQLLMQYGLECRQQFSAISSDLGWVPMGTPSERPPWIGCFVCKEHNHSMTYGPQHIPVTVMQWWMDFMERAQRVLSETPCGEAIRAPDLLEPCFIQRNCQTCCSYQGIQAMKAFVNWLASDVDQIITRKDSYWSYIVPLLTRPPVVEIVQNEVLLN